MSCEDCRRGLHDLAKHDVPAERKEETERAVKRHLEACVDCREFLECCGRLSCRELVDFLNDYIDDELPVERRALFDWHLSVCEDCARYVTGYRQTMRVSALALGGSGAELGAPPEELIRAILAARGESGGR